MHHRRSKTPARLRDWGRFGATTGDLSLPVCYFSYDGSPESTRRFVEAVADSAAGTKPPTTVVAQNHRHDAEDMVEIWGVARG